MVPFGLLRAWLAGTNCPVAALRVTERLFDVPDPTRSVVVLLGHRAAAALLTNRPVPALRLTVRPAIRSHLLSQATLREEAQLGAERGLLVRSNFPL